MYASISSRSRVGFPGAANPTSAAGRLSRLLLSTDRPTDLTSHSRPVVLHRTDPLRTY